MNQVNRQTIDIILIIMLFALLLLGGLVLTKDGIAEFLRSALP